MGLRELLKTYDGFFPTEPPKADPALVAYISQVCGGVGYGALIDSAARQWAKTVLDAAKVSGPCAGTITRWKEQAEPYLNGDVVAKRGKVQMCLLLADAYDSLRDPRERDGIHDERVDEDLLTMKGVLDVSWEDLMLATSEAWRQLLSRPGGEFVVGPTRTDVLTWRGEVAAFMKTDGFLLGEEATATYCKDYKVGQHIRIRYDDGETGWAEYLGDHKAAIANVPMADGLSYEDIVSLKMGDDGWLTWDRVLESKYDGKIAIKYDPPTQEAYSALRKHLDPLGYGIEGVVAGVAIVNVPKGTDWDSLENHFNGVDGATIGPLSEGEE